MKTNKKPKYLVRPRDYHIWVLDPSNGCYRSYSCRNVKHADGTEVQASPHMTFESLTEVYDFFPITKDQIETYEKKNQEYYDFVSWQSRSDGHGGCKGGTFGEYIEYKELNKRVKYALSKEKLVINFK